MIIIYKMAKLSWWLTKLIVITKYAGMVNIIAGKEIMPEYIQYQAIAKPIINEAYEMISSNEIQKKMKAELVVVKNKLYGFGASQIAAEHIVSLANY